VGYAPQPGLEALDALAEQARAGGLRVEIVQAGERNGVAPGVDLAAYRIVQEALTNARKHAGAVRVQVRVAYVPGAIDLEVSNDAGPGGPGGGAGRGLAGMRERVRLFGGTLEAGEDGRGGFRVHARLPLEARP
jgi:signal transduction histidine kinase